MVGHTIYVSLLGLLCCCEVILAAKASQHTKLSHKNCFYCSGFDGDSCINLSPNAQTNRNLTDRCRSHSTQLTSNMQEQYGNDLKKSLDSATELICVNTLKSISNGDRLGYQGCMARNKGQGYCLEAMSNETVSKYQLLKCIACSNEPCSAGMKLNNGFHYVNFVAVLIAIYSKYCN